jgi:predicted GNAT family acetyltransferase
MNAEVRNNPTEYRYEVLADGELAGYTQYVLRRGRIAFFHTEVYEPYEGLGLGSRLARAAFDDARARGLLVMPFCPFIASYIERHLDEYRDLVAPEMLSGDRLRARSLPQIVKTQIEKNWLSPTRGRTPPRG